MGLKVLNETAWSTADLRRFIKTGLDSLGARPDKIVTCVYKRGGSRTLGRASIGHNDGYSASECRRITLYLPRPDASDSGPWDEETVRLYAKTLAHEVDHNLGLRHDAMGGCNVNLIDDDRIAWCAGLSVGMKQVKPTATKRGAALLEMKALHVKTMLSTWERKAKMAATKVRKYRRSLAYYDRAMAAARSTGGAS